MVLPFLYILALLPFCSLASSFAHFPFSRLASRRFDLLQPFWICKLREGSEKLYFFPYERVGNTAMEARLNLDGNPICIIGAGGFIGSHLCEKIVTDTPHTILAVDIYNDKIKHLLEHPMGGQPHLSAGSIQFHRLNIINESRLENLIKMSDLTINLTGICTPADFIRRPLDTIYSNSIDALPVVRYCSENGKRLIHFSTCEVYGKTIGSYLPEDDPLRKIYIYARRMEKLLCATN